MKPVNYEPSLQQKIDALDSYRGKSDPGIYHAALDLIRDGEARGDDRLTGYAHYVAAEACYLYSEVHSHLQEHISAALLHSTRAGDTAIIGRCYNLLGCEAMIAGNNILALDYLMTAVRDIESSGSWDLLGAVQGNIGCIHSRLGQYETAMPYFHSAIENIRKGISNSRSPANLMYTYCLAGTAYFTLGHLQTAAEYLRLADEQLASAHSVYNDLVPECLRMQLAHAFGDEKTCRASIEKAMHLILSCGDSNDLFGDFCEVAKFLISIGDEKNASSVIDFLGTIEKGFTVPYMKMCVSDARICYYAMIGREDLRLRETARYYSLKQEQDEVDSRAMTVYIQIREEMETQRRREIAIRRENKKLKTLARYDALTGLPNRYYLDQEVIDAFEIAYQKQFRLGLGILDIDFFKDYNDRYGHQAGDTCLKLVGSVLSDISKRDDRTFAARYGGDEFIFFFKNMSDEEILSIAKNIRSEIASRTEKVFGSPVSVSQGIRNSVPRPQNRSWDYLHAADLALYTIKRSKKGGIRLIHNSRELKLT